MSYLANAQAIVFIPGFKGSVLENSNGKKIWFSLWSTGGLWTPNLSLPLSWHNGVQASDGVRPIRVLEKVLIKDIYGTAINEMKSLGLPVYTFPYDWRRSNNETVVAFKKFIEDVKAKHGEVHLVGHSNGGLLASSILKSNPELCASAILVGVPFKGGFGFVEDFTTGTSSGFNGSILSRDVLGTMTVPIGFFPLEGELSDPSGWQQLGLSPFGGKIPDDAAREHLINAIRDNKTFRESLVFPANWKGPPVTVFSGDGIDTIDEVVWKKPGEVDFEKSKKAKGDSRITYSRSLPPENLPAEIIHSSLPHDKLLNDPAFIVTLQKRVASSSQK